MCCCISELWFYYFDFDFDDFNDIKDFSDFMCVIEVFRVVLMFGLFVIVLDGGDYLGYVLDVFVFIVKEM